MPRIVLAVLLVLVAILIATGSTYLSLGKPRDERHARPDVSADASVIVGKPKVKLAVLVVFDQMRGDYLPRWREHFGKDGFNRLMDEGCWFSNCYYPYATTTTGPGHASIMAGCPSDRTGIVNNEWYERSLGTQVYCATTDRFENIGGKPSKKTVRTHISSSGASAKGGGSPERLAAASVGDNVKAASRGKVIGLSMKDRAAIFPSGHHADAAYWFNNGEWVTSTYYLETLPRWVHSVNKGKPGEKWFGKTWDKLKPELDYKALSTNVTTEGVANVKKLGVSFPHKVDGGHATIGNDYYEALTRTPFANDLLLGFAKTCIAEERLGQREGSDLLTISFSANDYCGHAYGPDSPEVLDITLRSDLIMAELLRYLDETVGKGNYTIAITADHGICPLPESSAKKGLDAVRIPAKPLKEEAEKFLTAKYGSPLGTSESRWIEQVAEPWIYLNLRQLDARNLNRDDVAATLAKWLAAKNGVSRTYTERQLLTLKNPDIIDRLVKASSFPGRSGDVYVLLNEWCLLTDPSYPTGTTHGSPWDYDRWVPLVCYGPGMPKGEQAENAAPQQAAIILSDALGIKPPKDAVFKLPKAMQK